MVSLKPMSKTKGEAIRVSPGEAEGEHRILNNRG